MPAELTPERKTYEANLPREDLKTAIYIDFEGFMDRPPTLAGYFCEQIFIQVVFDRTLESAASAKGCSVQEGKTAIANLMTRARYEGRRIDARRGR